MELLLNILWMLIALGALGVWQFCWARQKQGQRRKPVQEWTAFVCALVFLFFAVSLTDDLHSNLVCFDECASGRRQSFIGNVAHPSPPAAKFAAGSSSAILPRVASFGLLRGVLAIAILKQGSSSPCETGVRSGRAPPVFFL